MQSYLLRRTWSAAGTFRLLAQIAFKSANRGEAVITIALR
jgi:hypothetical protein